jgi:hypothetical protein
MCSARRSATFRQSDLDRAIRAAKKAGASEVILRCGDQEVVAATSVSEDDFQFRPFAWLTERYRDTTAWQNLSPSTRQQRARILEQIVSSAGNQPIAKITTAAIIAGRERRVHTPAHARRFFETLRGLFRWAHDAQIVKTDPTVDVTREAAARRFGSIPLEFDVHRDNPIAHEFSKPDSPRSTALYRHFDVNGVLLYVGIAVDPVQRLNGHRSGAYWYDQIDIIKIVRYPTREAALAGELEAIRTEKPLHNIAGRVAA